MTVNLIELPDKNKMVFTERVNEDSIRIDFRHEFVNYYETIKRKDYATVCFTLEENDTLIRIVDNMRIARGFKPMLPTKKIKEEDCDDDVWYYFFYAISECTEDGESTVIEAYVTETNAKDNNKTYTIKLTEEERKTMHDLVELQLRSRCHKGCADLLEESRKKMVARKEAEKILTNLENWITRKR